MKSLFFFFLTIILFLFNINPVQATDMDGDGMDDEWEIQYGLNPNNPQDAWEDLDEDFVLNLYEFILDAIPTNPASPSVIQVIPGQDLENVLESVPLGVVVRLPEGVFPLRFFHFSGTSGGLKLMIQGGWSADFTVYDPCLYVTELEAESGLDIISFSIEEEAANLVLENLSFHQPEGVSGAVGINIKQIKGNFVANNCSFTNNVFGGIDGALSFFISEQGQMNAWVVNTLIANNISDGIKLTSTDTSFVNFHLYQSTIYNAQETESGLGGTGLAITASDFGVANAKVFNSILFNSEANDLELNAFSDGAIEMAVSHTVFGFTDIDSDAEYTEQTNVSYTDPLFLSPDDNNFGLMENSPALEAGMELGLSLPLHQGFVNCEAISVSIFDPEPRFLSLQIFPNPASDYCSLTWNVADDFEIEKVILYDGLGRMVKTWNFSSPIVKEQNITLDLNNLAHGNYLLLAQSDNQIFREQLIIH